MNAPEGFAEPWQAQVFALAVELNRRGAFTWSEWARALAREIAAAGPDDGSRYYEAWLVALESLVAAKGLAAPADLARRTSEWRHAYQTTPHGLPVEL
ncbi:MAG: nitrile hydratase accessory protein [Caulobacteraceae bacterium]